MIRTMRTARPGHSTLVATLFLAALILAGGCAPASADVVTLNNGDELFGTLTRADAERIELVRNGSTTTWLVSQVVKVEFESFRAIPGEDTIESIKDPLIVAALKSPPTAKEYPQAARVDILDEFVIELTGRDTWTRTTRHIFAVLKEKARENANTSYGYFPDLDTQAILWGRSITPAKDGVGSGSVRYVADRTIADEADFYATPQYQRQHTVKYAIPEVNVGTIVDRCHRISRIKGDPFKPFGFEMSFRGTEPKKLARLIVKAPKDVPLSVEISERGAPILHEQREEDGKVVHVFTATDTPSILGEPGMAPLSQFVTRVNVSVPSSWAELIGDYAARVAPIASKALDTPAVQEACTRAIGNATEPLAKARALFGFVAREISYVGVAPGDFSHEPRDPALVLQQRQGNLLDKNFLYHCLLLRAGVPHNLVWLRPWRTGHLATGTPYFGQTSVLAVEIPDATDAMRLNLPTNELQSPNVQAALVQGAQGVRLPTGERLNVPLAAPETQGSTTTDKCEIGLDGTLTVQRTIRMRGEDESAWRGLKQLRAEHIRKLMEQSLHDEFPGAVLGNFEIVNLHDVTLPLSAVYDFTVPEYAIRSGNDLLAIPIPVAKNAYSAAGVGIPSRQTPMAWSTLTCERHTVSIKLPKGFTLHALPDSIFAGMPGYTYRSSFGFLVDRVLFFDEVRRDRQVLSPEEYPEFKRAVEERSKTADQWIVVRR